MRKVPVLQHDSARQSSLPEPLKRNWFRAGVQGEVGHGVPPWIVDPVRNAQIRKSAPGDEARAGIQEQNSEDGHESNDSGPE